MLQLQLPWITAYLSNTSSEYRSLKDKLTGNAIEVLKDKVVITNLSFKPGSVVADFSLRMRSSIDGEKLIKDSVTSGSFGQIPVNKTFDPFSNITGSISLNIQNQRISIYENSTLSIKCKGQISNTQTLSAGNALIWTLKGFEINSKSESRIYTAQEPEGNILKFKTVKLSDKGTARCFFGGAVRANTLEITIEVKPLPRVEISPNPVYVEEGKKVDVSCSITNNVNGMVYINSTKAAKGTNTTKITFDRITKDQSIICYAVTDKQKGPTKKAVLEFIAKDTKMCDSFTDDDGNKWPETASGKTAEVPCQGDFTGMISRYCAEDEKWGNPNDELCVRRVFIDIINNLVDIEDNIHTGTAEVLDMLVNVTEDTANTTLSTGDVITGVSALDKIAAIQEDVKVVEEDQIKQFFEAVDNILAPKRKQNWETMNKKKETSATSLLKTLENYGENVATKIENATEATIMTENLGMTSLLSFKDFFLPHLN
ncbi:uncharacterized protein LOC115223690 [Octopus sinensis]|uniref:Uncharacterized protein LOC115223690 n=1 Tax=Octopus sinensis TaxID=2607531 RepID=A0A6P7TFX5_9MOLL|nr:uncharacterized protein LOC115223690 [Octopus sinensis]